MLSEKNPPFNLPFGILGLIAEIISIIQFLAAFKINGIAWIGESFFTINFDAPNLLMRLIILIFILGPYIYFTGFLLSLFPSSNVSVLAYAFFIGLSMFFFEGILLNVDWLYWSLLKKSGNTASGMGLFGLGMLITLSIIGYISTIKKFDQYQEREDTTNAFLFVGVALLVWGIHYNIRF
ncbi:MAG: hypothetical protein SFU99_12055 [Saprospiraceae bacterium]|nr:hypothetical protein [Saprospiraceae bacterium]